MAEAWRPPPVWLGKNYLQWDVDLYLYEAADLLMYHCGHDVNEIRRWVLQRLRIRDSSLTEDEKHVLSDDSRLVRAAAGTEKARKRRSPLKALAMELVCASILRHLDRCPWAIAHCETRAGRPSSYAGPGKADISAVFPRTKVSMEFAIIGEVSAKRDVDDYHYLRQLAQGYNHAEKAIAAHPGLTAYCLLLNGGQIYQDKTLHNLYLNFLDRKSLTEDSAIRMVPFYAPDFGALTGTMAENLDIDDELYFEPNLLLEALEAVYLKIIQPELPTERMWMVNAFQQPINEAVERKRKLASEGAKGPGGR